MRISVTERCNLWCRYCRPKSGNHTDSEELSYDEILRLCRIFIRLGIHKYKITGGEPLVRPGILDFLEQIKSLSGVSQVTLTTNGTLLGDAVRRLAQAGIDGVNVSVDSLDPETYAEITGKDCLSDVLDGIRAAKDAGLLVKINKVILPDEEMEDIWPFFEFMREYDIPVRMIERMPLGSCQYVEPKLTGDRILKELEQRGWHMKPAARTMGNGPASYYKAEGIRGYLGLIEAVRHNFCKDCNRVRLLSDGSLKTCLYEPPGLQIKNLLREGASEEELAEKIRTEIFHKPQSHHFLEKPSAEEMYRIGG